MSGVDTEKDKRDSDVWMVSWDGSEQVRLTSSKDSESNPQWSPDGKYLAFLTSRAIGERRRRREEGQEEGRAGLAAESRRRRGGEADRHRGRHRRLRVVARQQAPGPGRRAIPIRPTIPRRWKAGSARRSRRSSSTATRSRTISRAISASCARTFTSSTSRRRRPSRSPAATSTIATRPGRRTARGSRSSASATRIPIARTTPTSTSSTPRRARRRRKLTTFAGPDEGKPAWSPDGKSIAYVQGDEPRYYAYNLAKLAVIPSTGGTPRVLTESLDRAVSAPVWSKDGKSILVDRRGRPRAVPGACARRRAAPSSRSRPAAGSSMPCRSGPMATCAVAVVHERASRIEVYARRAGQAAQADVAERVDVGHRVRESRGRRRSPPATATVVNGLLSRPAAAPAGQKLPLDPLDPRRSERAGRPLVRRRARVFRGQRLRRAAGELSRQFGPRLEVSEGNLRRLGQPGSGRSAGRRRLGDQERASPIRSGSASAAGATAASSPTTPSRPTRASRRRTPAPAARCSSRCTARTSTSCSTTPSWGRRGRARTSGSR